MIEHAYIHIPFCKRKCRYCSFISGENINNKDIYINSLLKEINYRYKQDKLKTLYFGGGTPSLSDPQDIAKIIKCFNFQDDPEITLEVNPETVEKPKFFDFKSIGINRISMGVQTFNNEILNFIGRQHNESLIYRAIDILKELYFENINIDLIYGLPFQTFNILKQDLCKLINLNITHISTYGLKIEENSFFFQNPPDSLPDQDTQANMYLYICNFLKENKFDHYEISNFAKNNYESRHNNAYWMNKMYYGFGLNACGYENNFRYRNISNLKEYIDDPLLKEENIFLSAKEQLEEEIFLALRLKRGIHINEINNKYNINFYNKYKNIIDKYINLNLLELNYNRLYLTEQGMLLSNEIMSEFIQVE